MMSAIPSRTMRWSSTQSTRIGVVAMILFLPVSGRRDDGLDDRALSRHARNPQDAADGFGPLFHAAHAPVVRLVAAGAQRLCIESATVVLNAKRQVAVVVEQLHADALRMRMAERIRDRLLSDSQHLLFDLRRAPA